MIRVNLVPQEILDKEAQKQQAVQVGIVVGALVLVLAGVSFSHYYTNVKLEKQLAEKNSQLSKLEKIVKQVEALEAQARAVRARLNVIKDLLSARELYPGFMTEVIKTFPAGVWLTTLGTSSEGTGLAVRMGSKAKAPEDVSEWLRTLASSDVFSSPVIGAIRMDPVTGEQTFSMTVAYSPRPVK
ncbi:MAG: PilN domain-containing protein [Elusimicrobiota bacterium]